MYISRLFEENIQIKVISQRQKVSPVSETDFQVHRNKSYSEYNHNWITNDD